jgi:hypothetical protein
MDSDDVSVVNGDKVAGLSIVLGYADFKVDLEWE